jgi:hypothetical protein
MLARVHSINYGSRGLLQSCFCPRRSVALFTRRGRTLAPMFWAGEDGVSLQRCHGACRLINASPCSGRAAMAISPIKDSPKFPHGTVLPVRDT